MLTTNFESTWSSIDTNFLQKYDGYLRIRHDRGINYLDYVKRYGRVNNQDIRWGENLLDIEICQDRGRQNGYHPDGCEQYHGSKCYWA